MGEGRPGKPFGDLQSENELLVDRDSGARYGLEMGRYHLLLTFPTRINFWALPRFQM